MTENKTMSEDQLPPLSFKVILIGDSGVGKTSLANQMVYRQFSTNLQSTIGTGIFKTVVPIGNTKVGFNIWDTAGHERFKSIIPMYCSNATVCVLVGSIDSEESIQRLDEWKSLVEAHGSPIFAAAINKIDLKDEHCQISIEDLRDQIMDKYPHLFFVSAKTGDNVQELFNTVAKECLNSFEHQEERPAPIELENQKTNTPCC